MLQIVQVTSQVVQLAMFCQCPAACYFQFSETKLNETSINILFHFPPFRKKSKRYSCNVSANFNFCRSSFQCTSNVVTRAVSSNDSADISNSAFFSFFFSDYKFFPSKRYFWQQYAGSWLRSCSTLSNQHPDSERFL